jgi:PucR family transcriptional regulator, purine catabolism regulatory protein
VLFILTKHPDDKIVIHRGDLVKGYITIGDILERPIFRNAYLATEKAGLLCQVTWVHILDVPETRSLIRGGELVLSTGIGFAERENGFLTYISQLIEGGAAGLCIELGTAVTEVPEHILKFADSKKFPIIIFPVQVHFVDITQDIHKIILFGRQNQMDYVEQISKRLQQLTVSAMGAKRILQYFHETTSYPVLYNRFQHKVITAGDTSEITPELAQQLLFEAKPDTEPKIINIPDSFNPVQKQGKVIVAQTITVLGIPRGILTLVVTQNQVDDYLLLLVEKVTNSLSLDELHHLSVEEQQMYGEQEWVEKVIHGESAELSGWNHLINSQDKFYCVAIIAYTNSSDDSVTELASIHESFDETDWQNTKTETSIAVRLTFTKQGFRPYLSVHHDTIILILEWEHKTFPVKSRIRQAFELLKHAFSQHNITCSTGIGNVVPVGKIPSSYDNAIATWQIREKAFSQDHLFYDESGIYRWIQLLEFDNRALELAKLNINKILDYDKQHNANLFQTLKMYLDYDRSKQKTAEQLFIHRQTLYHRLKLLEQLLHVDLEDPLQRLAMHVSVYFFQYKMGS